ncbi:carbon-nitrogen hydrolase family protein [Croceicoccus naphthovorans]|uniref:Nitrilase n=1 Tax=Croceicoccus naphthovorans TaxID=1348774 RepID=A0A0G3XFI9_9SPHN|nr:carbon-nitrogen hydrolase family protein [Croceicoccus naphthovorans]AKM09972.1 nitrilase [Croceicoccus naphthovorans]MBB3990860.1 putative amidohydrolase [Croceicoccus naphthovorans]
MADAPVTIALYQANTGIDPAANAQALVAAIQEAKAGGAQMLFTPEMSGLLDRDRKRGSQHIVDENADPVLAAVSDAAKAAGIWVAIGSLAVRGEGERFANRSFLVTPEGKIAARYDKIHMFDVDLDTGESWRESNAYEPGKAVVTAQTPIGRLGLAVCYDIRFPALFAALGDARCDAIALPAAFTVPTGKAHWELMLRARAVEASAYVIAAAQVGRHEDGRETYGHSMVVDPWGTVVLDMGGNGPAVGFARIDPSRIAEVRRQLPSLANRREIPKSQAS